jgi:hypothetical protein
MFGISSAIKEQGYREDLHYNQEKLFLKLLKIPVMNTQLSTNVFTKDVKEIMLAVFTNTRSKVISVADVWNIQRNKRARVQRRFSV